MPLGLETCLDRIAAREGVIHAFAWLDADGTRRRAAALDARAARALPLRGMVLGVKDIIDVAGMPTGMGSRAGESCRARRSAEVVRRIEAAGGLILGKTVTTEFAFFHPGPTRNPRNPAHSPGGSSSGSAAAVAAGFVDAAIGTQTNGSMIRPAAFCGVVGFKATHGSISTRGVLSWSPRLDAVGVFAASVAECARVARVIGDLEAASTPSAPPRLALVRSPVWEQAEPSQRESLEAVAATLRRRGATVEETELPPSFSRAHAAHSTIMAREGATHFQALQERNRDALSRQLNQLIDRGDAVTGAEYREALAQQAFLRRQLRDVLAGYDAILTPPACGEAPASIETTGNPTFCTIWSLCGVPAMSLPTGLGPHGLPLGVQLVGKFGGDAELLEVAAWCEEAMG